jgi:predicted branched-subunit amino acid permease
VLDSAVGVRSISTVVDPGGIAPLGVAVGVALGSLSTSAPYTWLSAPLMVAGASQLVLFTQIESGSTFLAAALAAILLNGRFVIYGAALASRFAATQPRWFMTVGPHYIVDQTYAMTLGDIADDDSDEAFRRYFMTAGTILWVTWTAAVGLGILLGPVLPPQIPLEFVLPASFVALVAPTVTRTDEVTTVLVGAVAAVVVSAPSVALLIAAAGGAAIGVTSRTR